MDGYLQSTLAANSFQQNRNNTPPPKVVVHFPPTNKEFSCSEIRAPDGIYPLLHETFFETIAPQFATGTRASVTSSKYKRDDSSGDDEDLLFITPTAALPIPNSRNGGLTASSSTSSMHGLSIVTSPQHNKLNSQPSPYLPMSPSYQQSITPTQSTPLHMLGTSHELASNDHHDYFTSASYNNGSSSVGSFSSLFTGGRSMSKTPSSVRNNSIVGSKPKNHLAKTKSSFVLRFLIHDNLQKVLATKTKEDQFVFFNIGSSFIWVDGQNKPKV
ncbi:hypothetical protein K501DRAFT_201970 [Backusella circina FSU 941]|nr:hypothetical protein K501DRAFT_201970 [Backusella circina FSU 941]